MAFPASHCTSCGTPIRASTTCRCSAGYCSRGRARCCGARISPRYPLVELLGRVAGRHVDSGRRADVAARDAAVAGRVVVRASSWRSGFGLIAAAFIDLSHMYLPDAHHARRRAARAAERAAARPDASWQESLLGAAVGFAIVWLPFDCLHRVLRGKPGMGLGDAKLVMLAGAWFGWQGRAVHAAGRRACRHAGRRSRVYLVRGQIEEPEAVKQERAELEQELCRRARKSARHRSELASIRWRASRSRLRQGAASPSARSWCWPCWSSWCSAGSSAKSCWGRMFGT